MIAQFRRFLAILLIASLAAPFPAQAAMLGTQQAFDGDRERIAGMLDRTEVQARLQAYGVSPADVKARVAALSDAEAVELAARIDELPAGGVGIVGAIVLVFLVLLVTDILGYTKVFPFTRSVK